MSINAHIASLAEKRAQIKEQIAEELARPLPDFMTIHDLKKHNLELKEEMQRYFVMLDKKTYNATS